MIVLIKKRKKKKDVKGKKMFQDSIDSDEKDKEIEEALSDFCFMAMEEEEDEDNNDLQQAFEDLNKDSIMLAKKNKELKDMMETMVKEIKKMKDKVASMEKKLEQTTSINKYLLEELKDKNKEMHKLFSGS